MVGKRETVRVGVTGHRPGRTMDLLAAQRAVRRAMGELARRHPKLVVVTGGAKGFDQWMARECVRRRIPFELVLPCQPELFTAYWTVEARMMLAALCRRAVDVILIRDDLAPYEVTPAIYHARNAAIVRQTDQLIAFWDGRRSGGTWWTIAHALELGKPVINAFRGFEVVTTDTLDQVNA
jgi:uncharacterized phage-like protein YoqJ